MAIIPALYIKGQTARICGNNFGSKIASIQPQPCVLRAISTDFVLVVLATVLHKSLDWAAPLSQSFSSRIFLGLWKSAVRTSDEHDRLSWPGLGRRVLTSNPMRQFFHARFSTIAGNCGNSVWKTHLQHVSSLLSRLVHFFAVLKDFTRYPAFVHLPCTESVPASTTTWLALSSLLDGALHESFAELDCA